MPNPKRRHSTRRTATPPLSRLSDRRRASPSAPTATRRSCPIAPAPSAARTRAALFWTSRKRQVDSSAHAHRHRARRRRFRQSSRAGDSRGDSRLPGSAGAGPSGWAGGGAARPARRAPGERRPAHRHPPCLGTHRHGGEGGPCRAHQARQLHARGSEAGARGQGGGLCDRRQHRRGHGYGQDGAGRAARRGPPGAGHAHAQLERAIPACCWTWAPTWTARRTTWSSLR